MARSGGRRGWWKVYEIYGVQEGGAVAGLAGQAAAATAAAAVLARYFRPWTRRLAMGAGPRVVPVQAWAFLLGFAIGALALAGCCFAVTAASLVYTDVVVRPRVARRMVAMLRDWAGVEAALDVACGRGLLLNAVALRLKKEGAGGRVVGMDLWLGGGGGGSMAATLKTSAAEGTQELVTCKTGEPRSLPFGDNYFDVVVSALGLHALGDDLGRGSAAAARQRTRALEEMVRVLKPGGQALLWDLTHGPEYGRALEELGMDSVFVSDPVPAYMLPSHIVRFTKPER